MSETRVITPQSPEWPGRFKDADKLNPPTRLYARGVPFDNDHIAIAVVGTRRPTEAGIEAATKIARALAECGFVVVSGMALGIDTVAHAAALQAGGKTVAVMGCGLDWDYPERNRALRKRVTQAGTFLSEYPDGTPPDAWRFPERNRIIAAISKGVVVIEGGERSGALITARHALDANGDVFAVPGSFRNAMADGPNELIRTSQAKLITKVEHVFEDIAPELVWSKPYNGQRSEGVTVDGDEAAILALLDDAPVTHDRLQQRTRMDLGRLALALCKLEARGLAVKRRFGYEITDAGARVRAALPE